MSISIEIPTDFFTPDEETKLRQLLNANTDPQFKTALSKVVFAALDEYKDMFLGSGLPSRADEIRQFRLYYLIKRYFDGRIPDELEISTMFQVPESKAKSLILNVLARFRYHLEEEITRTLQQIIQGAEHHHTPDDYRVFIGSENMIAELDRIISKAGVRYKTLSKVRNEPNMYAIASDSYALLCQQLHISPAGD